MSDLVYCCNLDKDIFLLLGIAYISCSQGSRTSINLSLRLFLINCCNSCGLILNIDLSLQLFLLKLSKVKFVRMSGSGSSILAYFYSKKATENARKKFKKEFNNYWCITSKTI